MATEMDLPIALGVAATNAGYRTLFTSAADLVASLQQAHLESNVLDKFRTYVAPSVLVVDELGYLPMDQNLGELDLPGGEPPPVTRRARSVPSNAGRLILRRQGRSRQVPRYGPAAQAWRSMAGDT
jgi:hypothetical protein